MKEGGPRPARARRRPAELSGVMKLPLVHPPAKPSALKSVAPSPTTALEAPPGRGLPRYTASRSQPFHPPRLSLYLYNFSLYRSGAIIESEYKYIDIYRYILSIDPFFFSEKWLNKRELFLKSHVCVGVMMKGDGS